jgi:hypothetical protein
MRLTHAALAAAVGVVISAAAVHYARGQQVSVSAAPAAAPAALAANVNGGRKLFNDPLWKYADKTVLPRLAESSLSAERIAVVVAAVQLDESRVIRAVDILQAPSDTAAKATQAALRAWQFKPPTDPIYGAAAGKWLSGKVTFYLVRDETGISVTAPADAPLAPRRRARGAERQ